MPGSYPIRRSCAHLQWACEVLLNYLAERGPGGWLLTWDRQWLDWRVRKQPLDNAFYCGLKARGLDRALADRAIDYLDSRGVLDLRLAGCIWIIDCPSRPPSEPLPEHTPQPPSNDTPDSNQCEPARPQLTMTIHKPRRRKGAS